jgi:hypothetical protein
MRRLPLALLAVVALLCALAVAAASLRHTGSLAFPIDDGYIYSNYALALAGGHPFTYNAGETSGGITGLGWYGLTTLAYWLLAPFHGLLGGLAPAEVRSANSDLAATAGHLYIAAYLPGVLCLIATAVGVYRLALLALPSLTKSAGMRSAFAWLLGAVAAADLGLVWGAMSGLEVPLSAAIAVWAVALLLAEAPGGVLGLSLLLAAFLPWARPDLLAVSGAALLWLVLRAFLGPQPASGRATALRAAGFYFASVLAGLAAMSLIYYLGWGKPLPSSFYAKVGGLRLGSRFFSATQELLVAGRTLPFVAGAVALAGGLLQWLSPPRTSAEISDLQRRESSWSALLLLLVTVIYTAALMATLPWFGQEDRYLLPLHPFVIVLVGLLMWRLFASLLDRVNIRPAVLVAGALVVAVLLAAGNYLWATRNYVVEVRNIRDAHILPALWISETTPPESLVASEPIGAAKLFTGRRTIDLVGLTTPATLGTYRDWPRAWEALRGAGANYLFYYPDWFDDRTPPPWAVERRRFSVPDNRIAGSDPIAVYELLWDRYTPPSP